MKSPVRWVGGKQAEADYLASLLPEHYCYVEVFGGGASVLLAKKPSVVEVLNDIDRDVTNLFQVVRDQPEAFAEAWRLTVVSRSEFDDLKGTDPDRLDPVLRAYRFLYLNRASFSGDMKRPSFGTSPRARSELAPWIERSQEWVSALHRRLQRVYIECLPWQELISLWAGGENPAPGKVFFLDPPYLGTKGYAAGEFGEEEYRALAGGLGGLEHRFLMTTNDHPLIRQVFDGCHITERSKHYSISLDAAARRPYKELIISNYPLPRQKQDTLFDLMEAGAQTTD